MINYRKKEVKHIEKDNDTLTEYDTVYNNFISNSKTRNPGI